MQAYLVEFVTRLDEPTIMKGHGLVTNKRASEGL